MSGGGGGGGGRRRIGGLRVQRRLDRFCRWLSPKRGACLHIAAPRLHATRHGPPASDTLRPPPAAAGAGRASPPPPASLPAWTPLRAPWSR